MSISNHPPDVRFGTIPSKLAGKGGRMQAKEDRRVGRTRKLLEDALHDLIVEKGYEAVTVQDIIDRANVGRSTFYAHYTDKQHVLFRHLAHLEAHLAEQQRLVRPKSADPVERGFGFSLAMFQPAQEYRRLWGAVGGKQTGVAIVRRIEGILEKVVGREIASLAPRGTSPAVRPAGITLNVVNSLLGLLTW